MSEHPANYISRFPTLGKNAFRVLCTDSSNRPGAVEDFLLTGNDTATQLLLPGFFIPYPELKDYGYIHYRLFGKIARTAGANSLDIEPVVNGVPTGVVINTGAIATRAGTGWVRLDIEIGIIQHEDKTAMQAVVLQLLSANNVGTKVDDIKVTGTYAWSPFTIPGLEIYFRLKNNVADASNVLDLRSFMAGHFYPRSI